jgi:hypothetical protein
MTDSRERLGETGGGRKKPVPPGGVGYRSTAAREIVAAGLAAGRTVAALSRASGVSERAIRRWRAEPAFAARIAEIRKEIMDRTVGRLSDLLASKGVDVIEGRLDARDAKTGRPTATIADVKEVVEIFTGVTSVAELKSRIEAIEAAQRQAKGRK